MPKNPALEYQAAQPAFLRRLKAGNAALDGRHNVQIPRARGGMSRGGRLDMQGEEGEDDPLMIDESGNVVSREEMEAMNSNKEKDGTKAEDTVEHKGLVEQDTSFQVRKEGNVASGFGKKRKAAKVVGDQGDAPIKGKEDEAEEPVKSLKDSTNDLQSVVASNKEAAKKDTSEAGAAKKGKRKKIKLSFDEPE